MRIRNTTPIKEYLKNRRNKLFFQLPSNWFWGRDVRQNYARLMKTQYWDYEKLRALQMRKLSKLLDFVYQHVPFYQKTFEKLRIHPEDIRELKDLEILPIINKTIVNKNYDDFIPDYKFQDLKVGETSGSSGEPLTFRKHPNFISIKAAANYRQMHWAGMGRYDKTVAFGSPIRSKGDAAFFKRDYKSKTWHFNTRDLGDANLQKIINAINEIKPDIIYGFFSILNLLANHLKYNDIRLKKYPKFIATTAELPDDEQRKNIEEVLRAQIYDWYGMTEGCASAAQCEYGSYHINMEYCYVETVERDGIKSIVGTNLDNPAFPLIRYDTGDSGQFLNNNCPCRRGLGVMKATAGRIRNFLRAPNGKRYFVPNSFSQRAEAEVREAQIIQNTIDSIDVRVVKRGNFGSEDMSKLKGWLEWYLEGQFKINVHFVGKIERKFRGKYQAVICNL